MGSTKISGRNGTTERFLEGNRGGGERERDEGIYFP